MKSYITVLAALLALILSTKAQDSGGDNQSAATGPTPPPKILLTKDLRHYLYGTTWTWTWKQGKKTTTITFEENMTAVTPFWTATFKVVSPTAVQLNLDDRIALLTFDPDYLSFKGKDFDRKSTVLGKRKE